MSAVGCTGCGARWLGFEADRACPACGRVALDPSVAPPPGEPERAVRFAVDTNRARRELEAFVKPVKFPVDELSAEILANRLEPVWWPHWLVDAAVKASWEAEVGYDYEVQSSVEVYGQGGWSRKDVSETRIRWEPRAGTVDRAYPNVAVPGLADQARRERLLGPAPTADSVPWDGALAADGALRLPDRTPAEQWPVAIARLRELIGADCAEACDAQHFRELRLDLDAEQAAWTWLLLPGWTTWYDDDDGERRILWIDGASGKVGGPRMASVAKGRKRAVGLGILALVLGSMGALIGLIGVILLPLLVVAAVLVLVAMVFAALVIPAATGPARHNRAELERTR